MRAGKVTSVAVNKGYGSFPLLLSFLLLLLLSVLQLAQLPWHGWAPGTAAVLEGGLELHCFPTRQFRACLSPGTVLRYHRPDTLVMWNLSSNRLVVYGSQKEWLDPQVLSWILSVRFQYRCGANSQCITMISNGKISKLNLKTSTTEIIMAMVLFSSGNLPAGAASHWSSWTMQCKKCLLALTEQLFQLQGKKVVLSRPSLAVLHVQDNTY